MFLIDGENPVPTIKELVPTVNFRNDRFESHFWANQFHRIQGAVVAAAPALNSMVSLLNPANSGSLLVVEFIDTGGTVAFRAQAASVVQAAGGVSAVIGIPRDFRASGGPGAAQLWTNNTTVGPGEQGRLHDVGLKFVQFAINPGQALTVWNPTVNSNVELTFGWFDTPIQKGTL